MTAGLSAYFLKLIQLGQLNDRHGNPVRNTPQALKDFISDPSEVVWSRAPVDDLPRPGIWNKAHVEGRICPWVPGQPPAKLLGRQQRKPESGVCFTAAKTTKTSSHATFSASKFIPTDFPTLSTGIVSKSGSSCASTAFQTDCALGPAGT